MRFTRIDPKIIKQHKNSVMNQFMLNMNKPTGLTPLYLKEKLLKISKKLDE